jgi:hypothetical protein
VTSPALEATRRGMLAAARNCGHWPTAGTLAEFAAAAQRAERVVDRAVECWQRWVRRWRPDPERLESGSGRVNVRHEVARQLVEQRSECVRLLIGPPAGSA